MSDTTQTPRQGDSAFVTEVPMSDLHVIPAWQEHDLSPLCWCQPVKDEDRLPPFLWIHRLANDGRHRVAEEQDPGPRRGGWNVVAAPEVAAAMETTR